MKQNLKNEADILGLINKIQEHLIVLDRKLDTLMSRSVPAAPKPPVQNAPAIARSNDHNKGRTMHTAICADCRKECTIPFKPSGDRPVYCKDCFSRRKVISLSGMKVEEKPKEIPPVQVAVVKSKKKAVAAKKTVAKKKSTPKKK